MAFENYDPQARVRELRQRANALRGSDPYKSASHPQHFDVLHEIAEIYDEIEFLQEEVQNEVSQ